MRLGEDPFKPKTIARALISTDATGAGVILSTDDWWLKEMVDELGNSAEEVGLCGNCDLGEPGLYLWTGHSQLTYDWESGQPDGHEWVGDLRPARLEEIAELYAMRPVGPEEAVDDEEVRE